MKLRIRAIRDYATFGPDWVWIAWLEDLAQPVRDRHGFMVPSYESIRVGMEYGSWADACRAGETAWAFASAAKIGGEWHLPLHRTEAGYPRCSTCDGGGCPDCTDPA